MAAATIVWFTFGGKRFRCSTRTRAHLRWTFWKLKLRHPRWKLIVLQGCYQPGVVSKSAGTHDLDCVLDFRIQGATWDQGQAFLRWCGWAAWHRTVAQGFDGDHLHAISLPPGLRANPTPDEIGRAYRRLGTKVGKYVDGGLSSTGQTIATSQVDDYYAHSLGLKGLHRAAIDRSPYPANINKTVFRQTGAAA